LKETFIFSQKKKKKKHSFLPAAADLQRNSPKDALPHASSFLLSASSLPTEIKPHHCSFIYLFIYFSLLLFHKRTAIVSLFNSLT
jgi:hypothetical protein